jgi:hypothetical protein
MARKRRQDDVTQNVEQEFYILGLATNVGDANTKPGMCQNLTAMPDLKLGWKKVAESTAFFTSSFGALNGFNSDNRYAYLWYSNQCEVVDTVNKTSIKVTVDEDVQWAGSYDDLLFFITTSSKVYRFKRDGSLISTYNTANGDRACVYRGRLFVANGKVLYFSSVDFQDLDKTNFATGTTVPQNPKVSYASGGMNWGTYYYKISASSGDGGWTGLSEEVKATIYRPPENLTILASAGGSLAPGTYYYRVSSLDDAGNVHRATEEVYAVADNTNKTITLSWTPAEDVSRYRVWRGTARGQENQYIDVTGTSLVDNGTLTWVSAPFVENGTVVLTWDASPGATRYRVWRGTASGSQVAYVEVTTTTFNDDGQQSWTNGDPPRDVFLSTEGGGYLLITHPTVNRISWLYVINDLLYIFTDGNLFILSVSIASNIPSSFYLLDSGILLPFSNSSLVVIRDMIFLVDKTGIYKFKTNTLERIDNLVADQVSQLDHFKAGAFFFEDKSCLAIPYRYQDLTLCYCIEYDVWFQLPYRAIRSFVNTNEEPCSLVGYPYPGQTGTVALHVMFSQTTYYPLKVKLCPTDFKVKRYKYMREILVKTNLACQMKVGFDDQYIVEMLAQYYGDLVGYKPTLQKKGVYFWLEFSEDSEVFMYIHFIKLKLTLLGEINYFYGQTPAWLG